eukprot:3775583-Ditylum_brightwellii.AAC.1
MESLLQSWIKENSTIYYEDVMSVVPREKILQKGLMMMKPDPYMFEAVEPLLLSTDFRKG